MKVDPVRNVKAVVLKLEIIRVKIFDGVRAVDDSRDRELLEIDETSSCKLVPNKDPPSRSFVRINKMQRRLGRAQMTLLAAYDALALLIQVWQF